MSKMFEIYNFFSKSYQNLAFESCTKEQASQCHLNAICMLNLSNQGFECRCSYDYIDISPNLPQESGRDCAQRKYFFY